MLIMIHETRSLSPPLIDPCYTGRIQITGAVGRQTRFANSTYKLQEHTTNDTQPAAV